jgi:hypothetical protein
MATTLVLYDSVFMARFSLVTISNKQQDNYVQYIIQTGNNIKRKKEKKKHIAGTIKAQYNNAKAILFQVLRRAPNSEQKQQ